MIPLSKLVIADSDIRFSLYPNGLRAFNEELLLGLGDVGVYGIADSQRTFGVAKLVYDVDADIFQKIQIRDNTEYEFAIELPISVQEFLDRCENNSLFPFNNQNLVNAVRFNGPDSCTMTPEGRYRITGRLNFESQAGTAYLDLNLGDGTELAIPIEVLTQKLDYQEEFQELLRQIAEYNASLLIRFDNATETTFGVSSQAELSPMIELMAFRRLLRGGRLSKFIREITSNPSKKVLSVVCREETAFVTNPDWTSLAYAAIDYDFVEGGNLASWFSGVTPTKLPDRKIRSSCDTKDNRFVKTSLQLLRSRLETLRQRMPSKYETSHTAMRKWAQELDEVLMVPFWRDIGSSSEFPNSMVMATRKGYREYIMLYLVFGLSLKIESERLLLSVGGDIKPVSHLYEMWCYLMVYELLCEITQSRGSPGLNFEMRDNEFMHELICKETKPIHFVYGDAPHEIQITLYYNKKFESINDRTVQWADSYSGVFNPDISIAFALNDNIHWLHFDAKYRLDLSDTNRNATSADPVSTYKKDDIHKMHTYRDALLGTRGSYVLYPGREAISDLYIRNPNKEYRDRNVMPSVGAFPLRPTESEVQTKQLNLIGTHIKQCIDALVRCEFPYKEESGLE